MTSERHLCTKEDPWTKDKGRAQHPDAKHVDDRYYEDGSGLDVYRCPHCDMEFKVELPQ